ncbi:MULTISPECIES: hypothetical protein [Streptomyces]|uniref:hypothetical protein n=1 Tax=Streptomyces TaxID=1883 RepID=UPI0009A14399|nr:MULTISPECIES: hypothetical protein [Streptomyces]
MAATLSLLSFQREASGLLLDLWRDSPSCTAATSLAFTALAAAITQQSGLPEHRAELQRLLDHARRPARATLAAGDDRAVLDGPAPLTRLLIRASVAYYTDESEQSAEMYRRVSTVRDPHGAWGSRVWTLPNHVDALIAMGLWPQAQALVDEGRSDAVVHRLPRVDMDLEALEVTLRALRGDSLPDVPLTSPHWRTVSLDENGATRARMLRASGLHALAVGDAERAFRHCSSLSGEDGTPVVPYLSPRSIGELATAAQRVGRNEEAARVLGAVRADLGERPTTRMTLLMHHAAALVDGAADPEHHFLLALVNGSSTPRRHRPSP